MLSQLTNAFRRYRLRAYYQWLRLHWSQLLLCSLMIYLLVQKDVTLSISFQNQIAQQVIASTTSKKEVPTAMSLLPVRSTKTYTIQQKKQLDYVSRFAKVARNEMDKYGIPASIKLAQGLLETSAGNSKLATNNNNHFGIKCFSKNCKKGHCSNFSDDSHKDFFRIFETAWESYRAHSQLLQNKRYIHLKGADYKTWAYGLSKAGYATDPKYGDKLIDLIESLELNRYDG